MKARIKPELVADEVIARGVANSPERPVGVSVLHETAELLAATAAHEADSASLAPRKPRYDAERLEEGRRSCIACRIARPTIERTTKPTGIASKH